MDELEIAWDLGGRPATCPHCGVESLQDLGIFEACPVCSFRVGEPGRNLHDLLVQAALQNRRPGHA